jgi:hypothetical protein
MAGNDLYGARLSQRPDVVDDIGAQIQHGLHDGRLEGIHRNRHAELDRLANQRHDPSKFLLQRHRRRAGPG